MAPTPVLLPGKSHGWRSLVGCSPWDAKSRTRLSDFTFTFHFHTLEKAMAPTPVFLLENPMNGGAWWAAVHGMQRVRHEWSDLAAAAAVTWGFLGGLRDSSSLIKNLPAEQEIQESRFHPRVRKIPWGRKWSPTPIFLPGNPVDTGAWRNTDCGVTKSRTQLSEHTN